MGQDHFLLVILKIHKFFISEQWLVDQEGFIRKVNDSSGIMILSKDIKTIEFFTLQELKQEIGESNDTRE